MKRTLQAIVVQRVNRTNAKKAKLNQSTTSRSVVTKVLITVNLEGYPLVLGWNQWLCTLKTRAFRKLNMTKPIDAQFEENLQEVKDCLEKII